MQIPATLLQSLHGLKGFDEKAFVQVHESGEQVTSIRLNPGKTGNAESLFPGAVKVPWSSSGYYLPERPSFTADPLFHAGAYYVQEASSMFLEQAVKQACNLSQPLRILDLCASPGGKSTLIQSLISGTSLLVSNEVIKTRAGVLAENITKWGAANVVVTNNDPKDFQRLPEYFDLVIVDAPCSGSGLFRKDPDAISEWSPANVELCSHRQERILADILPSLRPGAVLVYSTCSYSASENETIADKLLSMYPLQSLRLSIDQSWGITETLSPQHNAHGYRFYPDKVKGEGFFLAVFRKKEDAVAAANVNSGPEKVKQKDVPVSKAELKVLGHYLSGIDQLAFMKQGDSILAMPAGLLDDVQQLRSCLYLKKAGVNTGSIIRDELLPDHELALSGLLAGSVPFIETNADTALDYLRRKDISLQTGNKGWALIRYRGMNLGWVKILPGRVNNYYPKGWRILNK